MKKTITKLMLCIFSITLLVSCGKGEADSGTNSQGEAEKFITVPDEPKNLPIATIDIEGFGVIKAELYPHKAPNTVNNFIDLANSNFYDGVIFHRIISEFMAQGGDPQGTGAGGPGYSIAGEFPNNGFEVNDIKHKKGILSMARTDAMDTAGSQFFIMTADYPSLDGKYAAFGKVIEGMDVVDKLNAVKTARGDKPVEDVKINSIKVDTMGEKYDKPVKMK